MKANMIGLSKLIYLKKSKCGLLLEPNELFKVFSVLITALILTYVGIFQAINLASVDLISQMLNLLPLLLSVALLFSVYLKSFQLTRLIVICYLIALIAGVLFYNATITYSKVLMLPAFVLFFLNKTKKEKLWGGIYLCVTYAVIQIRYYLFELQEMTKHLFLFEVISIVFGIIFFVVCNWIKNEFLLYESEIKQRTLLLEEKNKVLEDLVCLNKRQSDKLKRTVLLKEKLMSILSHDIRTPIGAFKLLISNYEKKYIPEKAFIKGIVETKKDLMKIDAMVLDILLWSRNDTAKSGEVLITYQNYDEIFQSVQSLYALCIKNKKLEVSTETEIPEDMYLVISKREIEIILRNLLSNAIKFSNIEGKIMVSLKADEAEPHIAVLSVKDFGVGMSMERMQSLNSSKLISSTGTLDEVGIGIGLSIVFDVMNSNNLEHSIKSAENGGTEFSIRIPMMNC